MKKHRFSWIDGLIIAVVLVLIAGTCVKFLVKDKTSATRQTVSFTYELKISSVRQYTVDALQVGDTLYEEEGKGAVGTISSITTTPAKATIYLPDGTISEGISDERMDVVLTVTAEGYPEDGGYKVGTYHILVNSSTVYFTKYSIWNATVCAID